MKKTPLVIALSASMTFSAIAGAESPKNWYDTAMHYTIDQGIFDKEVMASDFITYTEAKAIVERLDSKLDLDLKLDDQALISRQDAASILAGLAKERGFKASQSRLLVSKLEDYKNNTPQEVVDCYNLGILRGRSKKSLNLDSKITRAEFAQTILNLRQLPQFKVQAKGPNKYGDLVLELESQKLFDAGLKYGDLLRVDFREESILVPFGEVYTNVDNDKDIIIPDKNDPSTTICAVKMGSFANRYSLKEGDQVKISLAEKEGYLEDFSIRRYYNLRTNRREDYSSDQVFANFREIKQGNLKEGLLFRSSSPINPKLGRAAFADKLMEEAGVTTVLNLTDNKEDIEKYLKNDKFNSPYYKSLLDKGNVALLDMSCDTGSQDFNQKFKQGLQFALEKEGPILVHCTEGQDRAGFVAAMLEALTGSSLEEIKKDYMTTYLNYYFFQEDSKQYEKIAAANILDKLREVTDLESLEQLENINLEEATEKYFIEKVGLSQEELKALKDKLTK